jgi:hypothetical protein
MSDARYYNTELRLDVLMGLKLSPSTTTITMTRDGRGMMTQDIMVVEFNEIVHKNQVRVVEPRSGTKIKQDAFFGMS